MAHDAPQPEEELESCRERVSELEGQLAAANSELSGLREAAKPLQERLTSAEAELTSLRAAAEAGMADSWAEAH